VPLQPLHTHLARRASSQPEQITAATMHSLWFQLYVQGEEREHANRGYAAVVLALHASTRGKREADERLANVAASSQGIVMAFLYSVGLACRYGAQQEGKCCSISLVLLCHL